MAYANSANPEQSIQCLHCLPPKYLLNKNKSKKKNKIKLKKKFEIWDIYCIKVLIEHSTVEFLEADLLKVRLISLSLITQLKRLHKQSPVVKISLF